MTTTPYFSVVVPVHDTRPYLDECLDSILSQGMTELEIIAVDDGSTDGSADALVERASLDPRVRVDVRSTQSGPGPTRNTGLALARGRYVLFLDSDDAFMPGALSSLRSRIEQCDDPDVVLFDYVFWAEDGRMSANPQSARMANAESPGVFHLSRHPDLLGVFNAPWSRAYNRHFVEEVGLTFPSGFYEDIPWSMTGLMSAERIAALDLPVVKYRQRSVGSILHSPSPRHFDVFAQWELVFAALTDNPAWEQYRQELFTFMIHQYDAMLLNPTRVPPRSRSAFFRRAAAACRRQVPDGWRAPSQGVLQGTRLRQYALVRGSYALYAGVGLVKPHVDSARAALQRAVHPGRAHGG